jgi:D-alanine---D-serine ligase
LEENIDGFEVACAIIGNKELLVGSLGELELADEGFLDYDEKYNTKKLRIHIPARLDDSLNKRVIETAKDIYRILGCSGLARIDMFIDKDKNIIFNEANTMPGFTANSLFPSMFLHSNIQYMDILDRLIELEIGEGR